MAETGIAVVGRGEVEIEPDTAVVRIGVRVTRRTIAEATRDAGRLAAAVLTALREHGIEERDVQTSRASVSPNYDHQPNRQPKVTGYTFTNIVTATARSVDSVGEVIDAALAAGGDDAVLEDVSFLREDDAAAIVEARAAAFADARAKAEQLAALAGLGLGAAVAIEEVEGAGPISPMPKMMRMAAESGGTAVAPGRVTTSVSVAVRFAIR
jgi:uncharacterized protein YggE